MNILIACDSNVERAGVCLFILQWIRGIEAAYRDSTIIVYFRKSVINNELKAEFESLGVKIITGNLPECETSLSLNNRKKVRCDISDILSAFPIDVVHVNSSAVGFSCIVLSQAYKYHIPVRISHSHGRNLGNGLKNIYLFFLKGLLKCLATRYAACSVDAGLYLFGKTGTQSDKWLFVPNTIDVDRFAFNGVERGIRRKSLGIDEGEIVIGSTGQLIVRKNHTFVLDVVAELKKRSINVKYIVLGEGDERRKLEAKIQDLNLTKDVLLLGETNEIPQWLSAMDIYIMPSLTEGLPIGAVEAQANGLCCLFSTGVPKDIDLTDDVYHLRLENNVGEWADLIENLPPKTNAQRLDGATIVTQAGFSSKLTPEYVKELYKNCE